MSISVREYGSQDADAFLILHRECLAYYNVPKATEAQKARVLALLNAQRHMACHLAFDGADPVGFATWGLSFPAGPGVSLVMKELFVSERVRGKGVGKALLSALIDVARDEGCERFDWATDGPNKAAQAFYAAIGAPALPKQNYRIPGEEFVAFQRRLQGL